MKAPARSMQPAYRSSAYTMASRAYSLSCVPIPRTSFSDEVGLQLIISYSSVFCPLRLHTHRQGHVHMLTCIALMQDEEGADAGSMNMRELNRWHSNSCISEGQAAVELFFRLNHARQTVDYVRRQVSLVVISAAVCHCTPGESHAKELGAVCTGHGWTVRGMMQHHHTCVRR